MNSDVSMAMGLMCVWLAIPAFVAAYAHRLRPVRAVAVLALGGGLIGAAILTNPDGYTFAELPDVVLGALRLLWD